MPMAKSAEPRRAADQRLAEFGLVFVEGACIEQTVQHVAHFVLAVEPAGRFGGCRHVSKVGRVSPRRDSASRRDAATCTRAKRRRRHRIIRSHRRRQPTQPFQARFIVRIAIINRAAHLRVHRRAAQLLRAKLPGRSRFSPAPARPDTSRNLRSSAACRTARAGIRRRRRSCP